MINKNSSEKMKDLFFYFQAEIDTTKYRGGRDYPDHGLFGVRIVLR
jgi:hypothetical protein